MYITYSYLRILNKMRYLKSYKLFEDIITYPNLNKDEILEIGADLTDNDYIVMPGDSYDHEGKERFIIVIARMLSYVDLSEIKDDFYSFINRMSINFNLIKYEVYSVDEYNPTLPSDKRPERIEGSSIEELLKIDVTAVTLRLTYEKK